MSGSVYDTFVKLSMINGVSPVAAVIVKDLLGITSSVKGLNGLLHSTFGKLTISAGLVGWGFVEVKNHAKDLSHEVTQLQKLNIGDFGLGEVRKQAREVTDAVKGVTEVDALKLYGASFSIFGHQNSLALMEPLAKFTQVAGNTSGNYKTAEESIFAMIRAGDLLGKFVNEQTHQVDLGQLQRFLDLGAKTMLISHGRVNAQTWLALAQQGGPAMSNMSDDGLMTMAILAQGMGGPRAGTALTSIYQQLVGGKMTEYAAHGLHDLGLVGDYKVGRGGHLMWNEGSLDTDFVKALKDKDADPIVMVQKLQEALVKHGEKTLEQQVPKLFELFGRQTSQREIHDLLRNLPQMIQERERMKASKGTNDALAIQNQGDIEQGEKNLSAAWTNMMTAIAGPQSENVVTVLNKIAEVFRWITDQVRAIDPAQFKGIVEKVSEWVGKIVSGVTWVWEKLKSGISTFIDVAGKAAKAVIDLANAIGELPAKVSAAISGFKLIGPSITPGVAPGPSNMGGSGGLGAPADGGYPTNMGKPQKSGALEPSYVPTGAAAPRQQVADVYLDGQKVGRVIERGIVQNNRTVQSANTFDSSAMWLHPEQA